MSKENVFTDEDLKRLNEGIATEPLWHVEGKELRALLARLEAAEAYIGALELFGKSQEGAEYEAWKAACVIEICMFSIILYDTITPDELVNEWQIREQLFAQMMGWA